MLSTFQIKNPSNTKKNLGSPQFDQNMLHDPDQRPSHLQSFNSPFSRQVNTKSNTLGELTQTFVQMIRKAPDQSIEIDEASRQLNIQKRRIYDITNVLEGIGYIEKLGKNKMKWVGGERGSQLEHEAMNLQSKHEKIEMETKQIESQIQNMKSELLSLSNHNSQFNFLSIQDITTIMKSLNVTQILLYAGQIGDQLQNDSNPEKRTSQCTIQSNTTQTKLFYCKLIDGYRLEVAQNISIPQTKQHIPEPLFKQKTANLLNYNYEQYPNDIFQESQSENNMFPVTPELNNHEFILNLPTFALSPPMERNERKTRNRQQDIFENDSS